MPGTVLKVLDLKPGILRGLKARAVRHNRRFQDELRLILTRAATPAKKKGTAANDSCDSPSKQDSITPVAPERG